MRAKVLVFAGTSLPARNFSKETSRSSVAPFVARCASTKPLIGRSRPPSRLRCTRTESTAARRARRSSACVGAASPCMNSAPSSTGTSRPGKRRVQQRPPMRLRASRMTTERPPRASASAAASPAAPAPTTTTSAASVLLRLDAGVGGDLAPDADFLLDLREELLGRAAGGSDAVVLQLLGGVLDRARPGQPVA